MSESSDIAITKTKPKLIYQACCEDCGEMFVTAFNARDLPRLSYERWKKHLEKHHND